MQSHASQIDEPSKRLAGFHIMAKPVGPICNLDCKYCFYLEKEKLYPHTSDWQMPDEILEAYIRQYIETQSVPAVSFAWQGGEPTLLGVDYFRRVVQLEKKYANGKRIENAFQTNGVLHNDEFNTLTVVQRHNSYHPLEVYRFLKEIGSGFMQFIPIVERMAAASAPDGLVLASPNSNGSARVSAWSVEPTQFGKFLSAIFDEWVRNDVGRYFVQIFDVALESWLGIEQGLCVF